MSTVTFELPSALKDRLEQIAGELNVSVSELLLDAAEKLSQVNTLERIGQSASKRNTHEVFERVLAAVPDVEPVHSDDVIRK